MDGLFAFDVDSRPSPSEQAAHEKSLACRTTAAPPLVYRGRESMSWNSVSVSGSPFKSLAA